VLRYERYLDLDGIEIEKQLVHLDSTVNARTSFNAVQSAIDFVDRGFRDGVPGSYTFFGPDADVLLDERFQRGYCFTLADADSLHKSQVGLRFTPANRKDGRVDIDGTLWIDVTGRSLNEIVFRYIGVEALAEAFNAGGRVGFKTLSKWRAVHRPMVAAPRGCSRHPRHGCRTLVAGVRGSRGRR
jgi:hypothetical protein